ncbi:MAG: hypothetical protein ACREL1_04615, partial [bacterium]
MEKALHPIVIPIHFLGFTNLINCWTLSLLSFAFLFLLLGWARVRPQWIPRGVQNFVELSMEFVWDMGEAQVGRHTA